MWFFKKKERSSVVLITIGSSTVSGAYVEYAQNELPTVHYNVQHVIEQRKAEKLETAMLRTLEHVGTDLIETGAPALRRATGNGFVSGVRVLIEGPWQQTTVRSVTVQPGGVFTFTRKMLSEVISSSSHVPDTHINLSESIIATILNGYAVTDPIGKSAKRAEILLLSSTLEKEVTEQIRTRLRKMYHTHSIEFLASSPITYSVLRDLYPHEKDFLAFDVASLQTDLLCIKRNLLVDVGTIPLGLHELQAATHAAERMGVEEEATMMRETADQPGYIQPDGNTRYRMRFEAAREKWLQSVSELLQKFGQQHALPRTVFVLTSTEAREYIKKGLNDNVMHELWLSDELLSVIALTSEQFTPYITTHSDSEISIHMAVFTLYLQKHMHA